MRFSCALAAISLGSGLAHAATTTSAAAPASTSGSSGIENCLAAAGVPYDPKNSSVWNADILPFNNRLQYTPAAVAVPTTVAHVQAAVSCGAKLGLKVNPKSGGHSYASFGLGGEDGHLVIELDRMYNVTVDCTTNIATVQTGARLGHVATQLYSQGGRAIAHGTCPGVGVGGHALHGGYGFSSHTHGLALDWIVGATVVLANATVVNCSSTENPDLFWAIRGAGSSYGVVTSFLFNTFAAPASVVPFSLYVNWQSAADLAKSWTAFQNYSLSGMPAELNMRLEIAPFLSSFEGLYHGTATNLQTALQPLLTALNLGLSGAQATDWLGGFNAWTYGQTTDVTSPTYNDQETFYSKSLATSALPASAIQAASDYWYNTARSNSRDWWVLIDAAGGNTSAFAAVPSNATAFVNRDKLFLFEFYDKSDNGTYPGDWAFSFLDGWVSSITNQLTTAQWGTYENYADPTMNRTVAQQNYFRQNLPRLQQIKYAVDPTEVFYFPQAIQAIQNPAS